jgi:hypothetical protein
MVCNLEEVMYVFKNLGFRPERVNDFATPCFINLRCRVVLFQSLSFALAVG